jgi:putative CocE/NonD family hydrolase
MYMASDIRFLLSYWVRLVVVLTCIGFKAVGAEPPFQQPPTGPFGVRVEKSLFVPMRDGSRMATDLYFPQPLAAKPASTILIRTPYGKNKLYEDGSRFNQEVRMFASHGFVVAVQDKRGKFESDGVYTIADHEIEDSYDSVQWLAQQPWSNGRIGTYGCSDMGDGQIYTAGGRPPALKAILPNASGTAIGAGGDFYRYFGSRYGGAMDWMNIISWINRNGFKYYPKLPPQVQRSDYLKYMSMLNPWPNPPSYTKSELEGFARELPEITILDRMGLPTNDLVDHLTHDPGDPYWSRFPYIDNSFRADVPALFIGSWYDLNPDVMLYQFNLMTHNSVTATSRDNQFIIIGPLTHCASQFSASVHTVVGQLDLGDATYPYYDTFIKWFRYWLDGDATAALHIPKVQYFVMGRGVWRHAPTWPIPGLKYEEFFLQSRGQANSASGDGHLVQQGMNMAQAGTEKSDTFEYDPSRPVPSLGGYEADPSDSGPYDQRPVESRNDVLVYTSSPLRKGIEVTGPVTAILYVSSSAKDTDFTVKLVDVYADGRAFDILQSILRARYRNGQTKKVWMDPGEAYKVEIPLGATSNYFREGHRIRLEVSSSNFPRFDRNLNTGGNNYDEVSWIVAQNSVHHGSGFPSRLILPIAP